ncbi:MULTISPECIES: hemolysin family protein [unclassified Rathayibacter]|uniref:hemolysin family protein n=1 Tax=unclassified Rathayibacter TaxID=2609250 RepID=UPI00188BF074|nr:MULTISPECIES: hemolysin family protein [unclassified Rathayibacter]MBF4461958.1 HlyC/CorC family transporter [Rathayibacter sp. VKM Ac-2879]MBF4503999.1 HlyC/CorC family transporter [Rathayibacter sp. VKM Ac-2878]
MGEYLPGIIWLVILLVVNAFFVGAEFAVISARRSQIEPKAEAGSKAAKTTLWAMEHATLMLATSQLGITVCSLVILNVSEPAIHHLLEIPLGFTSLSGEVIGVIAFIVALLLVTFLHVVLGEMVPKNISFSVPTRAALILAPPLVLVARIFNPVIWTLNALANAILRLFKVEPKDEATSAFTLDEVANIVQQSTREGLLLDRTGALTAAFEFTSKTVADVEVPISEMVLLPAGSSPADIQAAVTEHGYSRYILTNEDGDPTGYLHLKDVMDLTDPAAFTAPVPGKRIRRLASAFHGSDLEDVLATMRRTGAHVARVYDADGATTGVLFLEDIIEELVGEVDDATRV